MWQPRLTKEKNLKFKIALIKKKPAPPAGIIDLVDNTSAEGLDSIKEYHEYDTQLHQNLRFHSRSFEEYGVPHSLL